MDNIEAVIEKIRHDQEFSGKPKVLELFEYFVKNRHRFLNGKVIYLDTEGPFKGKEVNFSHDGQSVRERILRMKQALAGC